MADKLIATKATLRSIGSHVRADLVEQGAQNASWSSDLAGQCIRASFAVRDAILAAGYDARVYGGYFYVNWPNPATCFCGSEYMDHPQKCHYVPHAWVESGVYIVDVTAKQFIMRVVGGRLGQVEVASLIELSHWVRGWPPGVPEDGHWVPGELRRRDIRIPLR
jgi:hypothetical protein